VEAEIMANEPRKQEVEGALNLDASDPLSELARVTEQGQAALGHLQAMLADAALRVDELARANAVFEAVADALVAATLRASRNITHGDHTSKDSFALVHELAELARRSLLASGNGRSQLREYERVAAPARMAADEAHAALAKLSTLMKQLADSSAAGLLTPTIEVATPASPPPLPKDATTASIWSDPAPRRVRYKN
jgi:hypothetical protein